MTVEQQLEAGVRHEQAGRLREAETIYRQILSQHPEHFGATFLLGTLAVRVGRLDVGIDLLRQAARLKPEQPDAHYNLGIALHAKGKTQEAIAAFQNAIRLRPGSAESQNNLGTAFNDAGQLDEAIAAFRNAIRLKPDYAEAHYNLGIPLRSKGQLDEAMLASRQAVLLKPDFSAAHSNIGNILLERGQLDDAIASYQHAIQFASGDPHLHYNLGVALLRKGQLDAADAALRAAIALAPAMAEAHNNLGNTLKAKGELDGAIEAYRRAIDLKPDFAEAHSNLIVAIQYHPGYDAGMIRSELNRWNEQRAAPFQRFIQPHPNDRDPDRPLRIGYVSPDYCQHVVGRNILPLLRNHDHSQMSIFCYSNLLRSDGLTDQFRACADGWRDIATLSDSQAADLIRRDQIDILVDLALHTAGNRLGVLARKPAPVQVTFAGYPGSTGLDTIDYRLTDPYLNPLVLDDLFGPEIPYRLAHTFWCYDPFVEGLATNRLAAQSNGFVTFGCLNNFCKLNDHVLELWAAILSKVPHSRLLIMSPQGSARSRVNEQLGSHGVGAERIEHVGKQSRLEYLQTYHRIDIGLDTVPYNGHSTSLDCLWMGVPVVSLVGQTMVGRAGLSQLTNLGLPELVGDTAEDYVQIAAALACDLSRLSEFRRTLRPRLQSSPLMDAPRFARDIESAYRQM